MASSLLSDALPDLPPDLRTLLESLQSGLSAPSAPDPDRRPRLSELDRLEVRQVRPLVEIGQGLVHLKANGGPDFPLALNWLERWGGTFGPRSSAAANARRGDPVLAEDDDLPEQDPDSSTDRGGRPAWLLYFSCPECARRCRVLYSARGQSRYACHKCTRPAWQSTTTSSSGGPDASSWDQRHRFRLKHQRAADRIRRDYLQHAGPAPSPLLSTCYAIPKPHRMTWRRYEALCRLVEAHEMLALEVQLSHLQKTLAKMVPGMETPPEHPPSRWARAVLTLDAWALRQRSWHRRGRPRDTLGQGTRERLARMATSADDSGHAEKATT